MLAAGGLLLAAIAALGSTLVLPRLNSGTTRETGETTPQSALPERPAVTEPAGSALTADATATQAAATPTAMAPADGSGIVVLESQHLPGDINIGLAWDGESLWLSDLGTVMLFQTNAAGELLDSLIPDGGPLGLAWDGEALWLAELHSFGFAGETLSRIRVEAGEMVRLTAIVLTEGDLAGLAVTDMEWDGESLWICDPNQRRVFRITPTGSILSSFLYPEPVFGLAWDGTALWLVSEHDPQLSINQLSRVSPEGEVLLSVPAPVLGMGGLTWVDGQLWALGKDEIGAEMLFKLDVSGAAAPPP
jgi:hypothetical protein